MSKPSSWAPVTSFERPAADSNPVDELDAVLGGSEVSRFRSADGARGIVLPVAPPAGTGATFTLSDPVPGTAEILFLHPATGANAVDVLALLGDRGRSVRAALAEPGEVPGLAAEPVSVRLDKWPAVNYRLFRLTGRDRDRLAAGPKLGEGADGIADRGRWFGTRHDEPS